MEQKFINLKEIYSLHCLEKVCFSRKNLKSKPAADEAPVFSCGDKDPSAQVEWHLLGSILFDQRLELERVFAQ